MTAAPPIVSGTRATSSGRSNGRVCSDVGTPVQVNTGPVRGVRSQYGSVGDAPAATVTSHGSARVGSSRKKRAKGLPPVVSAGAVAGAADHPAGTDTVPGPAATAVPSG
jgi:hypothetical protein